MKELILRLLDSYEKRVHLVNSITQNFQHLIDRSRQRRLSLSNELCENLARRESLRRKDFDTMMAPLRSHYHKKERALRTCLSQYVQENRDMIGYLKSLLEPSLDPPVNGGRERLLGLQTNLRKMRRQLDGRERKVARALAEYHDDQVGYDSAMSTALKEGTGSAEKLKKVICGLLSEVLENDAQPTIINKEVIDAGSRYETTY